MLKMLLFLFRSTSKYDYEYINTQKQNPQILFCEVCVCVLRIRVIFSAFTNNLTPNIIIKKKRNPTQQNYAQRFFGCNNS